jgi:hypothetical protein
MRRLSQGKQQSKQKDDRSDGVDAPAERLGRYGFHMDMHGLPPFPKDRFSNKTLCALGSTMGSSANRGEVGNLMILCGEAAQNHQISTFTMIGVLPLQCLTVENPIC